MTEAQYTMAEVLGDAAALRAIPFERTTCIAAAGISAGMC